MRAGAGVGVLAGSSVKLAPSSAAVIFRSKTLPFCETSLQLTLPFSGTPTRTGRSSWSFSSSSTRRTSGETLIVIWRSDVASAGAEALGGAAGAGVELGCARARSSRGFSAKRASATAATSVTPPAAITQFRRLLARAGAAKLDETATSVFVCSARAAVWDPRPTRTVGSSFGAARSTSVSVSSSSVLRSRASSSTKASTSTAPRPPRARAASEKTSASSRQVAGRFARSRSRQLKTLPTTFSGRSGANGASAGSSPLTISQSTAASSESANSRRLAKSSQATTPSAQNVDAAIEAVQALDLLGREVAELAAHFARARRGDAPAARRDPEVRDLGVTVEAEHHVVRTHVAVNDAERLSVVAARFVSRVQTLGGLRQDLKRHAHRYFPLRGVRALDELGERDAADQLHHQERRFLLFAEVEDLHHIGVVDGRGETRFVQEHVDESTFVAQRWQQDFHCEQTAEAGHAATTHGEHLRHASARELRDDLVAIDALPDARDPKRGAHAFSFTQFDEPAALCRAFPEEPCAYCS